MQISAYQITSTLLVFTVPVKRSKGQKAWIVIKLSVKKDFTNNTVASIQIYSGIIVPTVDLRANGLVLINTTFLVVKHRNHINQQTKRHSTPNLVTSITSQ